MALKISRDTLSAVIFLALNSDTVYAEVVTRVTGSPEAGG